MGVVAAHLLQEPLLNEALLWGRQRLQISACSRVLFTHSISRGGLAIITGGTLFLTIIVNYPFSRPERLTSKPIDDVIQRMRIDHETGLDEG